jgi:hypothetical protein
MLYDWINWLDGNNDLFDIVSFAIDENNNMYLLGRTDSSEISINNNIIYNSSNAKNFITKLDMNGNLIWNEFIYGENIIYKLYVNNNTIYIIGKTTNYINILNNNYSNNGSYILTINNRISKIKWIDGVKMLAINNNDVYGCGYTNKNNNYAGFFFKMTNNNIIWLKWIDNIQEDRIDKLIVVNNDLYLLGYSDSFIYIDDNKYNINGSHFIFKYNTNDESSKWLILANGINYFYNMIGNNENIYLVGGTDKNIKINNNNYYNYNNNEFALVLNSNDGSPKWLKFLDNIIINAVKNYESIAYDSNNNLYLICDNKKEYSEIIKFNYNGNIDWTKPLYYNNNDLEYRGLYHVIIKNDNIYLLGGVKNNVTLKLNNMNMQIRNNNYNNHCYIMKINTLKIIEAFNNNNNMLLLFILVILLILVILIFVIHL